MELLTAIAKILSLRTKPALLHVKTGKAEFREGLGGENQMENLPLIQSSRNGLPSDDLAKIAHGAFLFAKNVVIICDNSQGSLLGGLRDLRQGGPRCRSSAGRRSIRKLFSRWLASLHWEVPQGRRFAGRPRGGGLLHRERRGEGLGRFGERRGRKRRFLRRRMSCPADFHL